MNSLSELQSDRHMILGLVVVTLADRAITIPHFHLEANPVVNAMGPIPWVVFTAGLMAALAAVWYRFELHEYLLPRTLIVTLTSITGLIFLSNLHVVLTA